MELAADFIPHKRLIDALIMGRKTQAEVNEFLKEHNFPTVSTENFKIINYRIHAAFPAHFKDETYPDTESLDESGVREMYAYLFDNRFFKNDSIPKEFIEKAFKAWEIPIVRRSLQAMAFAQISEEEIELFANAKYDPGYETESYMTFFKYFCDFFDWSYARRREYMETETNSDLKRLFSLALTQDTDFVVWKLGLAPTRSHADMLQDVIRDCFYNFKEHRDVNPDASQRWGTLMLKAMEKSKEVEPNEDKSSFSEEFRVQLKVTPIEKEIKTITQLDVEIPGIEELTGTKVMANLPVDIPVFEDEEEPKELDGEETE